MTNPHIMTVRFPRTVKKVWAGSKRLLLLISLPKELYHFDK
ncbi:hypothetical protein C1A50_0551 [Paenibacillus polymyxa]|nr:hypothetical protein C1A50_0551 [Paenibacillus polymyxa]